MSTTSSRREPTTNELVREFLRLVYGRRTIEAEEQLLLLLDNLDQHRSSVGLVPRENGTDLALFFYSQLASALLALITAPDLDMRPGYYYRFCQHKDTLQFIFAASGFGSASPLLELLSNRDSQGQRQISMEQFLRLWAFMPLDDVPAFAVDVLLKQRPELATPTILAWLSQRCVFTEHGETLRGRLLASGTLIEQATLHPPLFRPLGDAWMYCTYASAPHKHEIKRSLNTLLAHANATRVAKFKPRPRRRVDRPVMLVAGEHFRVGHAMFRCYAPAIRALRGRFQLVLIGPEDVFDDAARALFDDTIELANDGELTTGILDQLQALAPDVVYYPSVGMALWAARLATARIAPIQMMSGGHPATSMSPAMDYFLLPESIADASEGLSETAILLDWDSLFEPHPDALALPTPVQTKRNDDIIRIAINSTSMKLSYRVLEVCEQLQREAKHTIEFHFFPAVRGVAFDGLHATLARRLKNIEVHPMLPYRDFMTRLACCDLSLASFPFGNSNSTVDAFLLGIPVVAYEEPELSSLTDRYVFQHFDFYPDWLLASTDEAYFQAALRLVDHPAEREELSAQILASNPAEKLFGTLNNGTTKKSDTLGFAEGVWWLYQNHGAVIASGLHVLRAGHLPEPPSQG